MKTFLSIIFCLFLNLSLLHSGETEERANIGKYGIELLQKGDYKTLSNIAKKYRETEERTSSGRWKLSLLYSEIFYSIDMVVKDKYNNNWDALEEDLLSWTKSNPNDPTFHIIYASFLTSKAWMYRSERSAKNVLKENWEPFHKEVSKAIEYLNKHKSVAAQDPNWYVCMLDLAKLDSWDKISFYAFLDEAINKYPNYYSIYISALYFLDPKWNGYTKEEIEYIGEKILNATKDKDGAYARYYWIAKDILFRREPISILNIDWKVMDKSMERLIEKYPTQYNINGLAYLSCKFNQKKTTQIFISKIKGDFIPEIWKTKENFNVCNNLSHDTQKVSITTVAPDELINYINNYKKDKLLYIYFSSYKEDDVLKDVHKIERIANEYKNTVDFLSVNLYPNKHFAYPYLYKKFYLKKIPSSVIVYKNKIILRIDEIPSVAELMPDIIKTRIDATLNEMKYKNFLRYFKENITTESSFLNTEENIRLNMHEYLGVSTTSSKYKAYAVASNMEIDAWVSGRALNAKSQEEANAEALKDCEEEKLKYNIEKECTLYFIGNKYVFEKDNSFIVE